MTDYVKERIRDLSALHEVEGSAFRGYLDRMLTQTDLSLRKCNSEIEVRRLQGRASLLEELCRGIDGAFEELTRLRLTTAKPDMSKAF